MLGLNDKQIDIISTATPQSNYYFTNPDGNRLFSLGLGEVAQAFLAHTSVEDIKKARLFKNKHKDQFGYYWLKEYGQPDAAEYWQRLYNEMKDN